MVGEETNRSMEATALKTLVIRGQSAQAGANPRQLASGTFDKTFHGLMLVLIVTFSTFAQAAEIKGTIGRIGDTTHVEFRGLSQWSYEMKKVAPKVYELQLPSIDKATIAALATWSDPMVTSVDVKAAELDGNTIVTFKLADEKIETFDYLTDDPSRLILDFFVQTAESKAEEEQKPKAESPVAASTSANVATKLPAKKRSTGRNKIAGKEKDPDGYAKMKSSGRKPAGDERLRVEEAEKAKVESSARIGGISFDAADPEYKRLQVRDYEINEEAMIASRRNLYIRFPIYKMPVSILTQILENLPEFVINPKDTKENKEARLLLSLYNRQINKTDRTKDRIGAFLKVYDHFIKTFSESDYDEIIKNLAAHVYHLRYLSDKDPVDYEKSQSLYKYLVTKYPDSPLAERIQKILAFSALERGDGLVALQELQIYQKKYPESPIRDVVNFSIAESYLLLSKYSEAIDEYRKLSESALDPQKKVEAIYRKGDVWFEQNKWQEAESSYQSALDKFPSHLSIFPNALFNLAEAQFWQREYKEALNTHIKFLSTYPDDPYGGYSLTRAGEILEAMGVDRSRVVGAYLESYFRYRSNPGSEVARIRLLSEQMKGMKETELKKAIEEIDEIAKRSPLPLIGEFAVIMKADGMQRRGENGVALKDLIAYYQANPSSANLELFRTRILRNIAETMQHQVKVDSPLEALKTKATYEKTWLKGSDRIDVPFLEARAYEEAGAYDTAARIYSTTLKSLAKESSNKEFKVRKVNELLPSVESLRVRLATVAVEQREYPEAYRQLTQIKDTKELSQEEKNEHALISARVYKERGQVSEAKAILRAFIKGWSGDPALVAGNWLELAAMEVTSGEAEKAEVSSDQILAMRRNEISVTDLQVATAMELKARALENQGKTLAAIETYQDLLEEYENSRPLGSIRYHMGELLFQRGDLAGAEKAWMKLDEKDYGVLRRLAMEKLEGSRWQSENKKYLKRIPAMANVKGE